MSDPLLAAYRHDAHKFTGRSHENARTELAGVVVNQPVPLGADRDAAALSRPQRDPEQTVPTHSNRYRLSLLTGEPVASGLAPTVEDLLTVEDAETAHRQWLESDVAARVNESVYYPYTSLKYHTLLVAALLDAYRDGQSFADLQLLAGPPDEIVPFRTVFAGDRFTLRIESGRNERPSARLGRRPQQSWASVWSQLSAHPLDTDHDKYDMTLDANLRRITSWSTALQYIEDYAAWRPDR